MWLFFLSLSRGREGGSTGTLVSSPSLSVNSFSEQYQARINGISTMLNLIAGLSLPTVWYMMCCM